MLAEIGLTALFLAFLAAIYSVGAAVYGGRVHAENWVVSGRNAALLTLPLLIVSCGALLIALMTEQYQISYVWAVTDPATPSFYRFTALWGSQEGSLLFWSLLMSVFAAGALVLNWRSQRRLMPWVIAYTMATLAFFLGLSLFLENPFERYWIVTGDEAARRGQDVVLTSAGANETAVVSSLVNLNGVSEQEAAATLRSLPVRIRNCAPAGEVSRAVQLLEGAGGTLSLQPAHQCVIQTALIPPEATAPSNAGLAQSANGLNPLLRHFGMIIHPPMLYLGFVGFVIPFAFAMAALASGDLSSNWIKATRRWALVAWLFLSLGLILGGRWAYDVLGWGGYWGWDPVENAAFLPWLIGTAFLHSVMIQEKRGMLKVWNMFLVIATFSAVIFGTFATRSGLIESVHSFARSQIGFPMFAFWGIITLISTALLLWRRNRGELKDDHAFANLLSREALFVLNNVIFIALFVAIFWGSFGAPIISELFLDTNITLGTDYFMRVTPPLFAIMYLLMGIAPLSAWGATSLRRLGQATAVPLVLTLVSVVLLALGGMREIIALLAYGLVLFAGYVALFETYRGAAARHRTFGESWPRAVVALFGRNRRRYGGYIVHLGITIIGIGVLGSTLYQQETQQTIGLGQTLSIDNYELRYDNFTEAIANDGRLMQIADVTVLRDGQPVAALRPRIDVYPQQPMTIAGAHSTLENDFYVLLVGWEQISHTTATFKVYINPLINLVWWGGLILIVGTFIAAWPAEPALVRVEETSRRRRRRAEVTA